MIDSKLITLKNKKKILVLTFPTRLELTSSMLRIQEVYESPEFKNKKGFTVKEYKNWYTKEYGIFDYYEIWDGFNVPKYAFEHFIKYFPPYSQEECEILMNYWADDPDYVIAVCKDSDESTLSHELVHALYALNWQYRWSCRFTLMLLWKDLINCFKDLLEQKYDWSVLFDECNAYLVEGFWLPDKINNRSNFFKVKEKLIKLYETYSK